VVVGAHAIVHDERGRREDLGERSGLERLGEGTGPHAAVGAARRDGENFPARGIEHHDVAAVRFHIIDGVVERPLRDLLQLGIDREHDVTAGHRLGNHARWRLVLPACAILQDDGRARRPRQQGVE